MTSIKEITSISDKGYIDDPVKVKAIITELVNIPMGEIFDSVDKGHKELFLALLLLHNLEESIIEKITYPELLCLIDNLDNVMKDQRDPDAEEYKRFNIEHLKRVLIEAGKSNLLVREFLGIGIEALFKCLEGRHNDLAVDAVYDHILSEERNILETEKSLGRMCCLFGSSRSKRSVGDILHDTTEISNSSWNGWEKISKYKRKILTANAIDAEILMTGFLSGYREQINIEDLINKYTTPPPVLEIVPPDWFVMEDEDVIPPDWFVIGDEEITDAVDSENKEETKNGKNN